MWISSLHDIPLFINDYAERYSRNIEVRSQMSIRFFSKINMLSSYLILPHPTLTWLLTVLFRHIYHL